MWKLACCGGGYLQILSRSGYDKREGAVWLHSIPVIYNCPQKLVLKRKNSQIHLSASPVIEEGNLVVYASKSCLQKKEVYLSPQICKETISLRENKSPELCSPSLLSGAEIRWHFSDTVCVLSDLLPDAVVWCCPASCRGRLCQQWAHGLLIPVRSLEWNYL